MPGTSKPDVQLKQRSEGVQEDDANLNGTTLYRDKPRAQETHVPGSQRTWGTRLERHSGVGAGPPHSASTNH
ncbi:hypothetical protein Taro_051115, partial [Colocasia esculenta]|nr:hypothetical protein [Colocasia esculenta]